MVFIRTFYFLLVVCESVVLVRIEVAHQKIDIREAHIVDTVVSIGNKFRILLIF